MSYENGTPTSRRTPAGKRRKKKKKPSFLLGLTKFIFFLLLFYILVLFGSKLIKQIASGEELVFAASSYTVVVDAGHGGKDTGAIAEGIYEKDINLAVAKKLKKHLKGKKIKVILTRSDDTFLELWERTEISNRCRPDLFVSVHCNSIENNSSIAGLECYYEEGSDIGENIAQGISDFLDQTDSVYCRKIMAEDFYVLRNNDFPAVLIELGYLTNAEDKDKLSNEKEQNTLAETLAKAIENVLTQNN